MAKFYSTHSCSLVCTEATQHSQESTLLCNATAFTFEFPVFHKKKKRIVEMYLYIYMILKWKRCLLFTRFSCLPGISWQAFSKAWTSLVKWSTWFEQGLHRSTAPSLQLTKKIQLFSKSYKCKNMTIKYNRALFFFLQILETISFFH